MILVFCLIGFLIGATTAAAVLITGGGVVWSILTYIFCASLTILAMGIFASLRRKPHHFRPFLSPPATPPPRVRKPS
ncbi:MAG: hypothetical protein CR993_01985 [Rhodobacterales bacterium]|nr:MAG: hypothetical protein CR993_01985 [Rhodobacterales bacterium]